MSILSLGQIVGTNQRGLKQVSERVRTAVSEISQTADSSIAGGVDVDVSSQRLQARINTFREASQELAKNISDVAFAAKGTEDIGEALSALEAELSAAADKPLDEKSIQKINKFIAASRTKIDAAAGQVEAATSTLQSTQENASEENAQQNLKLNSKALLGEKATVSSTTDIRQMLTAVQNAAGKMATLKDEFKANLESFDLMATHLEVSMENQIAATSFLPQEETSILGILLGQSGTATAAQGNRLQSSLMNLI